MTKENLGGANKSRIKETTGAKPRLEYYPSQEETNLLFEENEWEATDEWGFELD